MLRPKISLCSFFLGLPLSLLSSPSNAFSTLSLRRTNARVSLLLDSITTTTSSVKIRLDDNDDFPDPHALMEYLDGSSDSDGGGGFLSFQEYQELQRRQQYLKSCPLFRDCSKGDLLRTAKSMVLQDVAAGEKLVTQGETGASAMYFLKSGTLQAVGEKQQQLENKNNNATTTIPQSQKQQKTETVIYTTYSKEGSFFGELALLFGQPRAASIVASEASKVYRLDKEAFSTSLVDSPVYDTAKRMILAKYKSKRIRDILPKIRIDELMGLVKARILTPKIRNLRRWRTTLQTYALGACATLLVMNHIQVAAFKPIVVVAMAVLAHIL
ncbi:expressed unknown protein [Seminavis robusta]|uniref:Cyclic nucleotide-binding domain-containing protein n=1 Tax=Seminavis robusta TaxID=568900 RepID=A0A9N8F0N5_9STRA|nr:expressed unknown protein [Seminavis robusta]|eukprot:Sro2436_g327610.1 n/a (327) ;mRNA; f:9653-10633